MNRNEILSQVKQIALEVGNFVRNERENFLPSSALQKAKNDLVSYVDTTSEKLIVDKLKQILPDAGFITEEGYESKRLTRNWIIDPLDGTTNFVHGIPCYAISIGLEENGKVILGVVYEISRNELFFAIEGGGAFLNGNSIHVSNVSDFNSALIATGLPVNNFSKMTAYLQTLEFFMRNTHGIRRIGAASVDLCYLACARVDAFYEFNLSPWDVAAGSLIACEAGAKVTDFSSGNSFLFGREIMAANPKLYDSFANVISASFVD